MKTALWIGGSAAVIAGLCYWWKQRGAKAGTSPAAAGNPDPTKNAPYHPIIPSINGSFTG